MNQEEWKDWEARNLHLSLTYDEASHELTINRPEFITDKEVRIGGLVLELRLLDMTVAILVENGFVMRFVLKPDVGNAIQFHRKDGLWAIDLDRLVMSGLSVLFRRNPCSDTLGPSVRWGSCPHFFLAICDKAPHAVDTGLSKRDD